jgi:hypothetical protein
MSDAMVLVAGVLILLGSGIGVVRLWQRAPGVWNDPQPWWIWGEKAWRVYRRSAAVLLGIWAAAVLGVAAGLAALPKAFTVAAVLLGLVVGPTLVLTIGLFNQPKRLVPPGFRSEPGLLAQRRASRVPKHRS